MATITEAKSQIENLTKIEYMQPKYGVVLEDTYQPMYGVIIEGDLQPDYGVTYEYQPMYGTPIIGEVQPAYGVQIIGGPDFMVSLTQIEETITKLKKTISTLKSSWNGETKSNLSTLDNSWVGKDCEQYTSKLTSMDKKVQNTIAALELLCSTYEQTRDMVKKNQTQTISYISNIE